MKRFLVFTFLLCAFIFSAFAQIVDPRTPLQNDPNVRYGKLENGLTYYIMHNDKPAQRAEFYLVTNVGAIQETKAQDGLAHFLEHMALNGTKNLPGKMMLNYFQKIGVEFGRNINASTGVEQTMYMLNNIPVTRQGIIDTSLLIMHDYSHFVTNDPNEINKERGVIVEEWRTRRNAGWRMHEKQLPYLFKGSKYAECTLIGAKENLETFPPEELAKFYQTWYRPDLQAVIVVGDINVDAIEAQIKTLFADIPAKKDAEPKVMPTLPDNKEPIVGIITDPEASMTSTTIYFKMDPLPNEVAPLGMAYLTDMMKGIITDILNERLDDISKQPNAPFINSGIGMGRIVKTKDVLMGQVVSKDGESIKAFTALMTELERAKKYGFTEAEYERAKTNNLRKLEQNKENSTSRKNEEFVYPLISHFLNNTPYITPEYEYNLAKGYLSIVPLEQINQLTANLDLENNVVIIYNSIEKEGVTHPTENQFIEAMAAAASANIKAPVQETSNEPLLDPSKLKGSAVKTIKEGPFGSSEWILKNGIRVIVKNTDFKKDEVLFKISNKGGRSLVETEDLPSIESNIFSIFCKSSGISKFPVTKLNKMLSGKAVTMNPYISTLYHGVNATCSPKDMETMFQLVYLSYTDPRFNKKEFQPSLDQIKAIVPNLEKQPNFGFQSEVYKVVYDNPRQFLISEKTLEKFKFSTLEKVCRSLFSNANGAVVTIVGNVDDKQLKSLVEKYIGSLPVGKKESNWIDRNQYVVSGKIDHPFNFPMTTPKTTVGFVVSGNMPFTAENIIKMDAVNYILDLIYTESIREEEGGTYGVSSYGHIDAEPKAKFDLQITFDTNPEKAPKLIQLAEDGINNLAKNGPSEEQLAKAKENFLKNITEKRIQNSYWRKCIIEKDLYNVDNDVNYVKLVESLNTESIKQFVQSMVEQGNFIKLVMSPKE